MAELSLLVRSGCPYVFVVSAEDERVIAAAREVAGALGRKLFLWSATSGLYPAGQTPPRLSESQGLRQAFEDVASFNGAALFVVLDAHRHLDNTDAMRRARDLAPALEKSARCVWFVGSEEKVPSDLRHDVELVHFPLPDEEELRAAIAGVGGNEVSAADRVLLARSALGLTLREARRAFAKAKALDSRLDGADVQRVLAEKQRLVRRSGAVSFFPAEKAMDDVGGLESLKEWVRERGRAFSEEGKRFGLPPPRGILLIGVQGCGKSLSCKAIASEWRMPLLRLDLGAVYSSYIGSSEENVRVALNVSEAVAPCVLWVDEVEKGLAGLGSSDHSDAGTSSRVFSTLLTWLQERRAPVFVVATANRIASLPPEVLRRGRFDELFFVDLPHEGERLAIFDIHVRARGRDPKRLDLARHAAASQGFSGAEIEQTIVDALYAAFAFGSELADEHVEGAIGRLVPLSRTMSEDVSGLQRWARDRARPASLSG